MNTIFPNYKVTKKEKKIIESFEKQTGFDLIGADEVTNRDSLKTCFKRNVQWLQDWAQEISYEMDEYTWG